MKLQDLKTKAELFEIANKEVDQPTLNIHITLQDKEVFKSLYAEVNEIKTTKIFNPSDISKRYFFTIEIGEYTFYINTPAKTITNYEAL